MTSIRALSCVAMLSLVLSVAACGSGDDDNPGVCEDDGGEACFVLPTAALTVTPNGGSPQAPNLNCSAFQVGTRTADLALSGVLKDYLSGDGSAGATVDAFYDGDPSGTPDLTATADGTGAYALTYPSGAPTMVTVRTRPASDGVDVIGYRVKVDTPDASVMIDAATLSSESATQIEGLVGLVRDPATGMTVIAADDCDEEGLTNAIVTLSSTSSAGGADPTFVAGYTFYSASGAFPAPVRRNVRESTSDTGFGFVLEVPPGTYYAQVWGFLTADDVAAGRAGLTLVSEIQLVAAANAATGVFLEPTQGPL